MTDVCLNLFAPIVNSDVPILSQLKLQFRWERDENHDETRIVFGESWWFLTTSSHLFLSSFLAEASQVRIFEAFETVQREGANVNLRHEQEVSADPIFVLGRRWIPGVSPRWMHGTLVWGITQPPYSGQCIQGVAALFPSTGAAAWTRGWDECDGKTLDSFR